MTELLAETTLVVARTPTGPIVRGGPGVAVGQRGDWTVVIDDFGSGRATPQRLEQVFDAIDVDPIGAMFGCFGKRALELFAIVGPPGVIAGSAPGDARQRIVVWVDPDDGTVAFGLGAIGVSGEWLALRAGTAVCWGPEGPQAVCNLMRGTVEPWSPTLLQLGAAS